MKTKMKRASRKGAKAQSAYKVAAMLRATVENYRQMACETTAVELPLGQIHFSLDALLKQCRDATDVSVLVRLAKECCIVRQHFPAAALLRDMQLCMNGGKPEAV